MSINSISSQYLRMSEAQGTAGNGGSVSVSYEDSVLTFTEADGDVYTFNAKNLSNAEIAKLTQSLNSNKGENGEEGEESETDPLQEEYEDLTSSADEKQGSIKRISGEIKTLYDDTLEEQEKITKDEYLRILDIVEEEVEQYKEDKMSGKNVNASDLQAAIMAGVSDSTYEKDITEVFDKLTGAESKMQQMSSLLGEYSDIVGDMKDIEAQQLVAQAAEAAESEGNIFSGNVSDVFSEEEINIIETCSASFMANNFYEVYSEKLEGHKEQYTAISDFRELDDSIIDMYLDFAENISTTVDQELNAQLQAQNKKDEQKVQDKKADQAAVDKQEGKDEQEEMPIAA